MKQSGNNEYNITEILMNRVFGLVSYDVIRDVASKHNMSFFSEELKEINLTRQETMASMFSSMYLLSLIGGDTVVLINDVGIDSFCKKWVEYLTEENDKIRRKSTGELDTLNLKMNYVINTVILKEEQI
jgi:hypothetical protein